jgi:hypothetical protein
MTLPVYGITCLADTDSKMMLSENTSGGSVAPTLDAMPHEILDGILNCFVDIWDVRDQLFLEMAYDKLKSKYQVRYSRKSI